MSMGITKTKLWNA